MKPLQGLRGTLAAPFSEAADTCYLIVEMLETSENSKTIFSTDNSKSCFGYETALRLRHPILQTKGPYFLISQSYLTAIY